MNDDTVRRQSRRETEPQRDPRRAVRYRKFDKQKMVAIYIYHNFATIMYASRMKYLTE